MKNSKQAWKKTLVAAAACACVIIGMGTISVAAGWLPIPDSFKTILGISTDEELKVANRIGTSTDVEFQEINEEDDSWFHGITENVGSSTNANRIEYYVAITYMDSKENNIFISLEDMQLWADDEKIDVSGKWEFDIPFEIQDSSVNLAAGQKFEYGNSEGTIDELMISPIGYSVKVTTTDKLSDSNFINMPIEIHFKNGETVELNGGCGPVDNDDGTWSWREDGVYGQMILLDNIESVVVGDTEFEMK